MTARIRIIVAIAILFALAAHPLAHPLLKECPCTHEVAMATAERVDSCALPLVAGSMAAVADGVVEEPAISSNSSRAPPVI